MTRKSSKPEFLEELVETLDISTQEIIVVEPPLLIVEEPSSTPEPEKPVVLAPKPQRVPPVVRAKQRNVPRFSRTLK